MLVLGGGVREGGALPPWVEARFELALSLSRGEPLLCLSAGTPHRPPPLDEQGFPYLESVAGARFAISRGYPAGRVYAETVSVDTIGNAYFSRVLFCDPMSWRRVRVVTSRFHLPRATAIFEWVYGLDPAVEVEFHAACDRGLQAEEIEARRLSEQRSLMSVSALQQRLGSMSALREWIHGEHEQYSAAQLARPRPPAVGGASY